MSIEIRDKDKLTDEDIIKEALNWRVPEDEDLPIIQRLFLYLLKKIKELEERIIALEAVKSRL